MNEHVTKENSRKNSKTFQNWWSQEIDLIFCVFVLGLIVPNTHTSCLLQASIPLCHAHLHFVSCFSTWMYLFLFRKYWSFFFSFGFLDFFPPFLEFLKMIYSTFWFRMFVFKEWQGKLCHLKFRNGSSKIIYFGALFLP